MDRLLKYVDMIEYYNKDEFLSAPIEITSIKEIFDAIDMSGRVIMPFVQEQSLVLHIGDRDYDVRDLVYRLLRAEGEVMALMEKVADLQTHIQVLEDKMGAQEPEVSYDMKALDDYIKGVWAKKVDW